LPYIISPLTYICNKLLSTGIFPTWLKFSQITPIFKKGNKAEISNYSQSHYIFFKSFWKSYL
jgi:hypothetical protein